MRISNYMEKANHAPLSNFKACAFSHISLFRQPDVALKGQAGVNGTLTVPVPEPRTNIKSG